MKPTGEGGFTLVEVVVSVVLMAVMVGAIGNLFVSNLTTVALGKARAVGLGLANEQMEDLRNLPYASLATENGTIYPPGNLPDNQTIVRDNYTFKVYTQIIYIHNPYDSNVAGYDYKQAEITVKLASTGVTVAFLSSYVGGSTIATPTNTGVLSISVINASGKPVAGASVTITNANQSPAVNISTTTNNDGIVVIPDLPDDSGNHYQVTATLAGDSTDGTIPKPAGSQKAVELNPNILADQVTSVTLAIDVLSTLDIQANDTNGNGISGLSITTTGSKEIKTNPIVYKYSVANATGSTGGIVLGGMEWDSYSFAVPASYYIVDSSPYQPSALSPNSTSTETLVVSQNASWPGITTVSPLSQPTGTASFSLAITGRNLPSSSTVELKQTGQTSISATGCTSSGSNPSMTLTCSLNLTGAATGNWDIDVTNATGSITQPGGLDVTP